MAGGGLRILWWKILWGAVDRRVATGLFEEQVNPAILANNELTIHAPAAAILAKSPPMSEDFLPKGLELVRIEAEELPLFSLDLKQRVVVVKSTEAPTKCAHCGSLALYAHGTRKQLIVDAPHFGQPTVLQIERRRWRCKDCKKTMSDPLYDIDEKRNISKRLVTYLCQNFVDLSFKDVAAQTGLSDSTVRKIVLEAANAFFVDDRFEQPTVLGIAEIQCGNAAYALLVNVSKNTLVDVLPNTTRTTLTTRLLRFSSPKRVAHVISWPNDRLETFALKICTAAHPPAPRAFLYGLARDAVDAALIDVAFTVYGRECFDAEDTQGLGERLFAAAKALRSTPLSAEGYTTLQAIAAPLETDGLTKIALRFHQHFYRLWPDIAQKHGASSYYDCVKALGSPPPETHTEIFSAFEDHRAALYALSYYPELSAFAAKMDRLTKAITEKGAGYSFEALRAKLLCSKLARQKGTVREAETDDALKLAGLGNIHSTRTGQDATRTRYVTRHYGADLDSLLAEIEAGTLF